MTREQAYTIRERYKKDNDTWNKYQAEKLLNRYKSDGLNLIISDTQNITLNDLSNDAIMKMINRISASRKGKFMDDVWIFIFKDVIFKRRIETINKIKRNVKNR